MDNVSSRYTLILKNLFANVCSAPTAPGRGLGAELGTLRGSAALSRLLSNVATRGSGIRKGIKKHDETISITFFRSGQKSGPPEPPEVIKSQFLPSSTFFDNNFFKVRSKVRSPEPPEVIKSQILPSSTFFDKLADNSGTRRTTAPRKNVVYSFFQRSL